MTNVGLFRDGQSCNSVNYWVTRVRPGQAEDSDQDTEWGLARGSASANGVTGVRGRVRAEVLVGPPCRQLRQTARTECNPAAVFALSCGGQPL